MQFLDLSKDVCPLPLIKVKLWLKQAEIGDEVTVTLYDPGSRRDIPTFLSALGNTVIELENDTHLKIRLRKLNHHLSVDHKSNSAS